MMRLTKLWTASLVNTHFVKNMMIAVKNMIAVKWKIAMNSHIEKTRL